MTIYAWKHTLDDEIMTIVPGADHASEMDSWYEIHFEEGASGEHFTTCHLTEPLEHLFQDDLSKFKKPLMIFTHATEDDRDTFINNHAFEVVRSAKAVDIQDTMIWVQKDEEEKAQAAKDLEDGKRVTIGEATGTDKEDRWDTVPSETAVMAAPKGVTGHGSGAHGGEGKLKKAENDKKEMKAEEDDEVDSILVRGTQVDKDGNVHVDIAVLDEREQEQVREMRKKAKEERAAKEAEIVEKAAAVGIDVNKPDTYTALEAGDTVIQQDNRLGISETVFANGHRIYRDLESGQGIPEDQIERLRKKREAAAQIRDIEAEEEREKNEAEEAAKKAEEEKSDLRKKLDKMRGVETKETKEETPEELEIRGGTLTDEVNQAVEEGFPSSRITALIEELVEEGKMTREFADEVLNDLPTNDVSEDDGDPVEERKLRRRLTDASAIYEKVKGIGAAGININRSQKPESGKKGDEFYFAVLPPGACDTDELTAMLGQEAFVTLISKKAFDKEGKVPSTDGGWFTREELDQWETASGISVEEIAPSIYKMNCNVGDAGRHFRTTGMAENGLLLTSMGVDIDNIPFDWPYHYKKNGQRITDNEMRLRAIRVLEIAREQGIVLADDAGEIDNNIAGVDQAGVAKTEQDVTAGVKKALGASGKTEDDVLDIIKDALIEAKKRVEDAGLTVDNLQNMPPEIKVLLENV